MHRNPFRWTKYWIAILNLFYTFCQKKVDWNIFGLRAHFHQFGQFDRFMGQILENFFLAMSVFWIYSEPIYMNIFIFILWWFGGWELEFFCSPRSLFSSDNHDKDLWKTITVRWRCINFICNIGGYIWAYMYFNIYASSRDKANEPIWSILHVVLWAFYSIKSLK